MAEPGVQISVWVPEDHMLSMPPNAKPSVNHQVQKKKIEQGVKDVLAEPDARV